MTAARIGPAALAVTACLILASPTDLYHLPPECPVGYDPTGTRTE